MSRIMNDLNLVREAAVRLANNLVRDMLTVVVLVGAMLWLDWLMALIVLFVYPLAMQPIIRIGARQRKASGNLQEHMEGCDLASGGNASGRAHGQGLPA